MEEVAKLSVSAKATLVIQQPNVWTPREVTNASVLSITSEIHTGKAVVILILARWVIKTVGQMQHVFQMSVVKICVKIHATGSTVDLIHSVKWLIIALDVHVHQVSAVIQILTVPASGFQYFAGIVKSVQIIKLVSMDNVDCSVAMIMNVLLVKSVSTRNVCCLASRTPVVPQEKLVSLVVIAKWVAEIIMTVLIKKLASKIGVKIHARSKVFVDQMLSVKLLITKQRVNVCLDSKDLQHQYWDVRGCIKYARLQYIVHLE